MRCVGKGDRAIKNRPDGIRRVLFLGYDRAKTRLIDGISARGVEVVHSDKPLSSIGNFDLVVSFGYRHIISSEVISGSPCRLINLHVSMLPWNRGAHPIFWSLFEDTPLGVSVHEIDCGVDTGAVIAQKGVVLESMSLTFEDAHRRMLREVEDLFLEVLDQLMQGTYVASPQVGVGSFHKSSDLPIEFSGWGSQISQEIIRLKRLEKSRPSKIDSDSHGSEMNTI